MVGEGDSRPIPDPTVLTTEAIKAAKEHTDREIHHLKELLEKALAGLDAQTSQRFTSQEQAVAAALAAVEKQTAAALAAAEKANEKTEANFAERIKQADATNAEVAKGLGDRITAVETRVSKTEAAVGG